MKRYAITIARLRRVKLPAGYGVAGSICRGFLEQHAPKKAAVKTGATKSAKPPAKDSPAPQSTKPKQRIRKSKAGAAKAAAVSSPAIRKGKINTPLQIPFGNKETAQKLGARYGKGGWYAPPGVNLDAFSKQGWV